MKKQFVSITVVLLLLLTVLPIMRGPELNISSAAVVKTVDNGDMNGYNILNSPPEPPNTPKGPCAAGAGIPLNFTTTTTDPENDQLYYLWDWGDGNMSDWLGPFNPKDPMTTNYTWYYDGNYSIRVKAKDSNNSESNWSKAFVISIGPQINVTNPKSGFIYLLVPAFNHSFFYSTLLDVLGACILLTINKLQIQANGTSAVKKVTFRIVDQKTGDAYQMNDTNSSDGYSFSIDVFRGVFELSVFAYDADNTFIDWYNIPFILFLRINSASSLLTKHFSSLGTNHHLPQ